MKNDKFLIVGLGSMGKRRIRNLQHLRAGEIIGFDPRADRRDEAAARYGIRTFADLDAALLEQPAALVISTPPDMHTEYAMTAAERGLHFFAEAGTTIDRMPEVDRLAAGKKLVAAQSCTMRFQPSIRRMKELIAGGAIGKLLTFTHHCGQYLPDWHPEEDYRRFYVSLRETGACREIVPFELTWLNWLVADNVAEVQAARAKLSQIEADIDDTYHLLLRYGRGALGHVLVDVVARAPVRVCRILGEQGTIEWSMLERQLRIYNAMTRKWTTETEPPAVTEAGYSEMSAEGMYIAEMEAFVAAIRGYAPWPFSVTDYVNTLTILAGAESSADTGARVRL